MDIKYMQDESYLSVGVKMTCPAAVDNEYRVPVPGEPLPSISSLFMNQYTPQQIPLYSSELPNISVNYSMNSASHIYESEEDIITLDSCKVNELDQRADVPQGRLQMEAHKMQVCKACGKTFKFQTSLLRHNNKVHISRYQCSACCRVFSRQSYLDVHTSKQGTSCFIEQKAKSKKRH